jgi:hypothetical protein
VAGVAISVRQGNDDLTTAAKSKGLRAHFEDPILCGGARTFARSKLPEAGEVLALLHAVHSTGPKSSAL